MKKHVFYNSIFLLCALCMYAHDSMCMRKVSAQASALQRLLMPNVLQRAYSLPTVPKEVAPHIIALDEQIKQREQAVKAIKRTNWKVRLQDIEYISYLPLLVESCFILKYGIKAMLHPIGMTALAASLFVMAVTPLTPYDKRLIVQHKAAISVLQEEKVGLFKKHT
ncbi:MAG: hypothetical protein AB7F19_06555 [Candidatus Babeliales bacterium]